MIRQNGLLFVALLILGLAGPAHSQTNIEFIDDVDAFTDEDLSRVVVYANEQESYGRRNALVWRCDGSDDYDLFLTSNEFFGTQSGRPVIHRFDGGEARSEVWHSSTEGTATFAGKDAATWFTYYATSASEGLLGVTSHRGTRYEYSFALSGLTRHLARLSCSEAILGGPPEQGPEVQPTLDPIEIQIPLRYAYEAVRFMALREGEISEDLNVVHADGLSITLSDTSDGVRLAFEGVNRNLYEDIQENLRAERGMYPSSQASLGFVRSVNELLPRAIEILGNPQNFSGTVENIDVRMPDDNDTKFYGRAYAYVTLASDDSLGAEVVGTYEDHILNDYEILDPSLPYFGNRDNLWGCIEIAEVGAIEVLVLTNSASATDVQQRRHFTACVKRP